ncbi:Uncharacterised protein [Lederbergia lenta]|uniref:Uncharacterized protein n=1 Tax=Lederbergia lenta TaxID=1467 RepID=A0A2X4WIY7_LEDLE|nr:Uncharacterised protein [Lederbergia lenta]
MLEEMLLIAGEVTVLYLVVKQLLLRGIDDSAFDKGKRNI